MNRIILGTARSLSLPARFRWLRLPVKIGMITTLSTPGGYLGEDMRDGFMLAIKEGDGKLGGIPVELVVADDGLNPTTGKTIAERMLQQDKIKLFTGSIFTAVTLAIIPDILRANAFFINNNNGPKEHDGANCKPNYFASAWQNDASAGSAGVAANEFGAKRVVTIAANYYTGLEFVASFKKNFKGQVVDQILGQAQSDSTTPPKFPRLRRSSRTASTRSSRAAWASASCGSYGRPACRTSRFFQAPRSMAA